MAAAFYRTTFRVHGQGAFPFDMLRHDGCYPDSSQDSIAIERTVSRHFTRPADSIVVLRKGHRGREPHITPARWASFGWRVTDVRTERIG